MLWRRRKFLYVRENGMNFSVATQDLPWRTIQAVLDRKVTKEKRIDYWIDVGSGVDTNYKFDRYLHKSCTITIRGNGLDDFIQGEDE